MENRSHSLTPSTLPLRSRDQVCSEYLAGYCEKSDSCLKSHDVCLIEEPKDPFALFAALSIATSQNQLSSSDRVNHGGIFDNDGPGDMSTDGLARHDNDKLDIRHVQIFPTVDEILCQRRPYLPPKDFDQPHFLDKGPERLIDTLFRHLRYDNIEKIIDVVYYAFQRLVFSPILCSSSDDYEIRHDTPIGNRAFIYKDVAFESPEFHEKKGLTIRISFSCPHFLQSRKLHASSHLEDGMLAALVGKDRSDASLSATFFTFGLRESTDSKRASRGEHGRAGVQLRFVQNNNADDIRRILYYARGILRGQFYLVEFPGILPVGFSYCLERLQAQIHTSRFPFAEHISPLLSSSREIVQPPAYALESNFSYDLHTLATLEVKRNGPPFRIRANFQGEWAEQEESIAREYLHNHTTLDDGQSDALVKSLQRRLAFTQGPPGTGKTHLGVALVKTILASQPRDHQTPILAVCRTNHALDSFLLDITTDVTQDIVRLGSTSKESWTGKYLLRALLGQSKGTQIENARRWRAKNCVESLAVEGQSSCESLSGPGLSWFSLKQHVKESYRDIYDQFAAIKVSGDRIRARHQQDAARFGYESWVRGVDLSLIETLEEECAGILGLDGQNIDSAGLLLTNNILSQIGISARETDRIYQNKSIWSMNATERKELATKWEEEIGMISVVDRTVEIHCRHQAAVQRLYETINSQHARMLTKKKVIGLTTTACAKHWDLLGTLGIKTVVCEEAGEVLEAHTLNTLLPTIEHAIFIGDPLQLRPLVNTPALSLDNDTGHQYRLDESLFERLALPSTPGTVPVPMSVLSLQRRMHPEIADLCRATSYPQLLDHKKTLSHPPVAGMVDRLFWFNHRVPEDPVDRTSQFAKSSSNAYEVEMVSCLVEYLVSQNVYDLHDIAVLTPYNGQLAALNFRLSSFCSVYLNEADREALIDEEFLDPAAIGADGKVKIEMTRMLRAATIDNFQGEEAKVVIMSTVRSNERGTVGFLRTENRINVAISRARDGFYVVGNASLMGNVAIWSKIISVFASNQKLGESFKLRCDRHPDNMKHVYEPSDFQSSSKCIIPCGITRPCGHVCLEKCHPESTHERSRCTEPCGRKFPACGHQCLSTCGIPCGSCQVKTVVALSCEHFVQTTCGQQQKGQLPLCSRVVSTSESSPDGHVKDVICHQRNSKPVVNIKDS